MVRVSIDLTSRHSVSYGDILGTFFDLDDRAGSHSRERLILCAVPHNSEWSRQV